MGARRRKAFGLVLAALALLAARPVRAQDNELAEACAVASQDARSFCLLVAQAIEIAQPRLGMALTGGNPVPGTASTLGMRLGTLPRISLAGRGTAMRTSIPDIRTRGSEDAIDFFIPSLDLDAAVGLFSGFSPAPTVGGLGSIDVLASVGVIPVPSGEGFAEESPFSWALGARVGILRESFLLPGISVSGMYRRLGDVAYGDPELRGSAQGGDDAFFTAENISTLSVRAAIGKRLLFLGATAGVGYDRYSGDVAFGVRTLIGSDRFPDRGSIELENDRISAFANLSWTLLILHVVGEVGFQSGADQVGTLPPTEVDPEEGSLFASLAVRLSI
ncbi:MAG: hypothetical protein HY561_03350 [Gemmatimonadetes bacterium]|nr:hypothetical protein [Gemmatimonadota bacterium]